MKKFELNQTIPTNVLPCFTVSFYEQNGSNKIEYSVTYKSYKLALKDFKSERFKAKGKRFIDIQYYVEYEFTDINGRKKYVNTEKITLVDNYCDIKNKE